MITIHVDTDKERQAADNALRDGILHEVLGESLTIVVRGPRFPLTDDLPRGFQIGDGNTQINSF